MLAAVSLAKALTLAPFSCAQAITIGFVVSTGVFAAKPYTDTDLIAIGENARDCTVEGIVADTRPPPIYEMAYSVRPIAPVVESDAYIAHSRAAQVPVTQDLSGVDLAGMTLIPGAYFSSSWLFINGRLTLDAQHDPSAQFIFQVGSGLTTSATSSINLVNGAQAQNVFWQIGTCATLAAGTTFAGNILALTAMSISTEAIVQDDPYVLRAPGNLIRDTIEVHGTCVAFAIPGTSTVIPSSTSECSRIRTVTTTVHPACSPEVNYSTIISRTTVTRRVACNTFACPTQLMTMTTSIPVCAPWPRRTTITAWPSCPPAFTTTVTEREEAQATATPYCSHAPTATDWEKTTFTHTRTESDRQRCSFDPYPSPAAAPEYYY